MATKRQLEAAYQEGRRLEELKLAHMEGVSLQEALKLMGKAYDVPRAHRDPLGIWDIGNNALKEQLRKDAVTPVKVEVKPRTYRDSATFFWLFTVPAIYIETFCRWLKHWRYL